MRYLSIISQWHRTRLGRALRRGFTLVAILLFAHGFLPAHAASAVAFQDIFANRELSTADRESLSADNSSSTSEAGEPRHSGRPANHSVWVSWTAPSDGIMTLDARGSRIDAVVAVYALEPGDKPPLERLKPVASRGKDQGSAAELVQFGALSGVRYEFAVDSYSASSTGDIRLDWDFTPVSSPPPVNLVVPPDQALRIGDTLTLTIGFEAGNNVNFQWEYNEDDTSLPGQSAATLVLPNFQANQVGQYRVRFTVDRVRFYSMPVEIQVNSEGVVTALARNRLEDALDNPLGGALASATRPRSGLRLQGAGLAGAVRGYNGSQIFHTIYAGRDPGEPQHCGVAGGSSYWLAYVPPASGTLSLDTEGSSYDTVLAVYTFDPPLAGYGSLVPVACDNNSGAGGIASRLQFAASQGRNYLVVVDGVNGARGIAQLNYLLESAPPAQAPNILSSPAARSVVLGAATSFAVAVTGTAPLAYQWLKNNTEIAGATGATLDIPAVQVNDAGSYSVRVTNTAGTATSTAAVLTVLEPPGINASPANRSVVVGSPTSFLVSATGTAPLSFQWLKNDTEIAGATSSTLEIPAVQVNDAGSYSVRVTNTAGTATSTAAVLTVLEPPSIGASPANRSVVVGRPTSFQINATGTAPLAYQWLKNGAEISGATSATLEIAAVKVSDAGNYVVRVTNAAGTSTSKEAVLTVLEPPSLGASPVNRSVVVGSPTSFQVSATGTAPLAYQWLMNGAEIAGATSATLDIAAVQVSDAGSYAVRVTNSAGTATSSAALLSVLEPPSIGASPGNRSVVVGSATSFQISATGTAPLAYQWLKNGAEIAGATSPTLDIPAVQVNDAGSYSVRVTNSAGTSTSTAAVLAVLEPPSIGASPVNRSVVVGSPTSFQINATGTAPLAYQWLKNGAEIVGAASATLEIAVVKVSDAGSYVVRVSNAAGTAMSTAAVLTVLEPPSIGASPVNRSMVVGSPTIFQISATGTAPLAYQWLKNGAEISDATNATLEIAAVKVSDAGSYVVRVTNAAGTATSTAAVLTVLEPPNISASPVNRSVVVGSPTIFQTSTTGTAPLAYQWLKNGAEIAGATSATLEIAAVKVSDAGSYVVRVTNAAGTATSSAAVLTVLEPPQIVVAPVAQSVVEGLPAAFHVTVTGTAPLAYQWFKDGTPLAGATASVLEFQAATLADAGSYGVRVTNSVGSATSAGALLTVRSAGQGPRILSLTSEVVAEVGTEVVLRVAADGDLPLRYQWLKDGQRMSGADSAELRMASVQIPEAGIYTVEITNAAGTVTSSGVPLRLWSRPRLGWEPDLGRFRVTFVAAGGVSYLIETASSTTGPAAVWKPWTGAVASLGGVVTVDAPASSVGAFFVRVRIGDPRAAAP